MFLGKRKQIVRFVLALILVSALNFALGAAFAREQLMSNDRQVIVPPGTARNFQMVVDAWNTIQQNYVDRTAIDPTRLTYGAISGMVDALGDTGHSHFLSSGMESNDYSLASGQSQGIGIELAQKDGQVIIANLITGSSAQKAGVDPGDILIKVDGIEIGGQTIEKVNTSLSGPAGSQVKITLENPESQQIRTLTLMRAAITTDVVSWSMIPGTSIAQIYIAAFFNGVTRDLKNALAEIKTLHATGVILDLRNNPGGLVIEAVGVTSQFLQSGDVVQEKDVNGFTRMIAVNAGESATDIPMVILVNRRTASSAEIVAGALQDAGRSRLIGETTFGTGTMLNAFPLQDQSVILLATQEWFTPKGRTLWHTGIKPDEVVSLPVNMSPLLPEALKKLTPAEFKASQDTQLNTAIEILAANGQNLPGN